MRRFNRAVTQRVGALDDHYLGLDRPLGEARLLWEIGDGCDIRRLRSRLDLDSGYVSRLLRSLEAAGLVTVDASDRDRRVRIARLTKSGQAERTRLDRRADAFAASLLEPLSETKRDRLVAAMGEVERLLTATLVEFASVDPDHPHARYCLDEYYTEIDQRFDDGFDAALSRAPDASIFRPPAGDFVVATLHGDPVGCGALAFHGDDPPEIKRMWVAPSARGLGVGRRLVAELEARAAASGSTVVRLETNRTLPEAIALYRSLGYTEVEPFNDERYAHHWFEKRLAVMPSTQRGHGSRTGGGSTPRRSRRGDS